MILGVGCDLAAIERIRNAVTQQSFVDRIFTPAEQAEAAQYRDPAAYYTGRWAAKEAAAKALGCGFGGQCSPCDVEILHGENNAPVLTFAGHAAAVARSRGVCRRHVSLSHDAGMAVAVVILED